MGPHFQLQHSGETFYVLNSEFEFVVSTSDKTNANTFSFLDDPVQMNKWYQVIGVYTGSDIRIYVNGDLETAETLSADLKSSTQPIFIGSQGKNSRFFNGTIDEVEIYNKSLTSEEIKNLYDYEKPN